MTKVRSTLHPNLAIIQELNNNMPSYLKPIGHDKTQKRNLTKLRNYIQKVNDSILLKSKEKSVGKVITTHSNVSITKKTVDLILRSAEKSPSKQNNIQIPMLRKGKTGTIKINKKILVMSREKVI